MDLISEIKNKLSILELLSWLNLQPNGSGFIFSIYKDEKTPSLKIYPATNSYHCFATGKGGDVITFYQDFYRINTKTAVKELAERLNISAVGLKESIPNKPKSLARIRKTFKPKYSLLKSEKEIFEERVGIILEDTTIKVETAKNIAYSYILHQRKLTQIKIFESLYKFNISKGINEDIHRYLTGPKRGLTDETINKFKLFSINSVKENIEFLRDTFPKDEVLIAGLFKNKYFLFTKHRLIIPYIENERVVYLRGRYFYKGNFEPENFGKYIGLNNWSQTLSPKRFFNLDVLNRLVPFALLIITEGEFDCMVVIQSNYNAIGIPGVTNFPKDQVNLLQHYNVHLAFDNDAAGEKAVIEISELFDKPVKVLKLKSHKDVTELLNE